MEVLLVDFVGEVAHCVDTVEDEIHGTEESEADAIDTPEEATTRVGACVETVGFLHAQRSRRVRFYASSGLEPSANTWRSQTVDSERLWSVASNVLFGSVLNGSN